MFAALAAALAVSLAAPSAAPAANEREQKVHEDKAAVEEAGYWIYNDIEAGVARARELSKPMVVVLRCIP